MITHIVAKVGALFLMLAVGGFARQRKIITDEALGNLCGIVLYVTLPFLFIYVLSTRCTKETLLSLWSAPLFAGAIVFTGYAIGALAARLLRLSPKRSGTFALLVSFQNSAFLAIPIGFALFGEKGVLAIIIFSIGFNVLYWTFGVWLFGASASACRDRVPGSRLRTLRNLLNPGIIALFVGVILGYFCVKLPAFFLDASKLLGDATIPLAMLVVGAVLARGLLSKKADMKEMSVLILCRLILVPIIFLALVTYFKGLPNVLRSIIMLEACMPSASTSPILAKRFGGDYDLAASGVFFTTLFSIITIPIFMGLI